MKLVLKELNENQENEFREFLKSFDGEKIVPMAIDIKDKTFSEYLKHLHTMKTDPPRLLVPATTLFLQNEETGEILGAIDIRHFLNDGLLTFGGHIGYGVKKEARGQKLAGTMLKMAKPILENLNLEEVLICCDKENIASAKTIIASGGVLEDERKKIENGKDVITQRYWLNIKSL